MRIILHIVFICSALAVGLPARLDASSAQPQQQPGAPGAHPAPRRPSEWWKTPKYMQELKLTAKQSAELDQIIQASRARMTADKEDLDRAQSDFRQLMERPDTNQRELLKAAERLEMARYSIAKERTMMGVRIHSVLTPEQRRLLDGIAKRHEADRNRQSQNQGQKQNQK
jgi:Spy/CpxP family protein refolding chaperone